MSQLQAQTRQPDLLLVADDSDDGTATLVRELGETVSYDVSVFDAPGGVGAAREALRKRAPDGLLVCLDAGIDVPEDWLAAHIDIHDATSETVVASGPWPGHGVSGTLVEPSPHHPSYFVEANCSMQTATAEFLGGWDPAFSRGCDWDFRVRLAREPNVVAVVSESVAASQRPENVGGLLHVRAKLGRPSSIPYVRKYGPWYVRFHPAHVAGDALGVSALAALGLAPAVPASLVWAAAATVAYGLVDRPAGYSWLERVVASVAIFALGWSTIRAVVPRFLLPPWGWH